MENTYENKRLILKVLKPADANLVLAFYKMNQEFFEPFEPKRPENFYTLAFHKANLQFENEAFKKGNYLRLWIFLKDEPDYPVGTICFSNFIRGAFRCCTLGYKTDYAHCHTGIMSGALDFIIPVIMKEYDLHRIEAYVLPENFPSMCLLKELKFNEESIIHSYAEIGGRWRNHLLYTYINPDDEASESVEPDELIAATDNAAAGAMDDLPPVGLTSADIGLDGSALVDFGLDGVSPIESLSSQPTSISDIDELPPVGSMSADIGLDGSSIVPDDLLDFDLSASADSISDK